MVIRDLMDRNTGIGNYLWASADRLYTSEMVEGGPRGSEGKTQTISLVCYFVRSGCISCDLICRHFFAARSVDWGVLSLQLDYECDRDLDGIVNHWGKSLFTDPEIYLDGCSWWISLDIYFIRTEHDQPSPSVFGHYLGVDLYCGGRIGFE